MRILDSDLYKITRAHLAKELKFAWIELINYLRRDGTYLNGGTRRLLVHYETHYEITSLDGSILFTSDETTCATDALLAQHYKLEQIQKWLEGGIKSFNENIG